MSSDDHNQGGEAHPDCVDPRPHGWHILTGGKPTTDKTCPGRHACESDGAGHCQHCGAEEPPPWPVNPEVSR